MRTDPSRVRRALTRRRGALAALGLAALSLGSLGCQGVDFTEKESLGGPLMDLDEDPCEAHFRQKAGDSREGSAGGRGAGAGGGCGCY